MDDATQPPPRKPGWTWEAILVPGVIAVVLVVLILPIFAMVRGLSQTAQCGKYQSKLMAVKWQEDADARTSPGSAVTSPVPLRDAHEARGLACRLFELMAVKPIPNAMFKCPASQTKEPGRRPTLGGDGVPAWGMGPEGVVSYAWDWSAPADPGAARVIMADRDPLAHHGSSVACYGDAHVKTIRHVRVEGFRAAGALVTEGCDGKAIEVRALNPDVADDDIYSADGDGGDPLTPGKGDALRAWVK